MGQSRADWQSTGRRATRCPCVFVTAGDLLRRLITHNTSLATLSASSLPCNWSSHCYACLASDLLKQRQLAVRELVNLSPEQRGPVKRPAKHQHLPTAQNAWETKSPLRQLMAHHYGHAALSMTVSFMHRVLSRQLMPVLPPSRMSISWPNIAIPPSLGCGTSMVYPCWRTKDTEGKKMPMKS